MFRVLFFLFIVIPIIEIAVLLQIDLTDTGSKSSIEIMKTFDVFGLPSILFFDLQGNELTQMRVTGFKNADQFTAHISQFL